MQPYRKDKIEIIDENDNVIGIEERGKVHQEGLLHREVHVWLYTPKGEILFQHRAKDVETYPDLLDASVGGHVEINDSYEKTAVKEIEEETGLKIKPEDLHFIKMSRCSSHDKATDRRNNSLKAVYAYCYNGDPNDLKHEEGKSYGFVPWSIDKLFNISGEDKERFIAAIFTEEFLDIFRRIKEIINKPNLPL
ncbi:MAG: NUDIX domain-containing protein [Candidatus Uhrbacteria bacterium]|nr:NUDIX domain-containing protein [Patescibacteria group bacterium]MBU1906830.1 NUDIX domain-containing protein [Patescibacteria group bacterium]